MDTAACCRVLQCPKGSTSVGQSALRAYERRKEVAGPRQLINVWRDERADVHPLRAQLHEQQRGQLCTPRVPAHPDVGQAMPCIHAMGYLC